MAEREVPPGLEIKTDVQPGEMPEERPKDIVPSCYNPFSFVWSPFGLVGRFMHKRRIIDRKKTTQEARESLDKLEASFQEKIEITKPRIANLKREAVQLGKTQKKMAILKLKQAGYLEKYTDQIIKNLDAIALMKIKLDYLWMGQTAQETAKVFMGASRKYLNQDTTAEMDATADEMNETMNEWTMFQDAFEELSRVTVTETLNDEDMYEQELEDLLSEDTGEEEYFVAPVEPLIVPNKPNKKEKRDPIPVGL
jgi:hypothetical protein